MRSSGGAEIPPLEPGVRFDAASGEIAGPSGTARLAPQPAALLALLLEHAGTLVDRDRIKDELWPGGKVEFDQGIAFAVREIRKALDAVGADPALVETLPRRGLRLNLARASSEPAGGPGSGAGQGRGGAGDDSAGAGDGRADAMDARPGASHGRGRPRRLAAALVIVVLAGGALALASRANARPVVAVFAYEVGLEGAVLDQGAAGVGERIGLAITARTATELRGRLGVIGPTATAVLSGPEDTDGARAELGACLVVSGTLRYGGLDTVYVFSQIVRTADRVHAWARWDTAAAKGAAERVAAEVVRALEEARVGC